jgi:hypothetical protein
MALTPEGKVKAKVKKILDEYGAYHFSPNMAGYGRSGVPDIIACMRGQFIAIECKAGSNQPTALQRRELQRIDDAGGMSIVVNEETVDALRTVLKVVGFYPNKREKQ